MYVITTEHGAVIAGPYVDFDVARQLQRSFEYVTLVRRVSDGVILAVSAPGSGRGAVAAKKRAERANLAHRRAEREREVELCRTWDRVLP